MNRGLVAVLFVSTLAGCLAPPEDSAETVPTVPVGLARVRVPESLERI